ncbi:MAG: hypothetical protein H0W87_02035 [Actinobacteria bacterium]|nr:hypothetical protein [Actinomycetota bacterium]
MRAFSSAFVVAALAASSALVGSSTGDSSRIPPGVRVHWLDGRRTHGWALTPYYVAGRGKRLCGWRRYGTNTSATRVCETFDRGKHWHMAFPNHPREGDDVTIGDAPYRSNFYFDVIGTFWRSKGIAYVSGSYDHCGWTVRSFNNGRNWPNWRNVDGTQDCGPGP